ncbi:kelch repeat-containing protein [Flavobacterium sp. KACC 22761]|uniref:kelch repeat-containing protein n=1 Tax=Flavobacterium sp. KACC 22761 TaxID=3092665 RepID=UPI002A7547D9|nr:kelch repeat-containing protein [Flavobacterium sp. KACC 22761]WPO76955.1 kelch repeat-containing protein [Flavobacterium sp. KACC 22761]
MKKLLSLLIIIPFFSNAQIINGIIKSQIGNLPIEDANAYVLHAKIGTITNDKGEFSLNQKIEENDTLQVSHIGHITSKIAIADLKKLNYIIILKDDIQNLKNVKISNRNVKLKPKLHSIKLAPLPTKIASFGSILNNNKIYILGGDASIKADPWEKVRQERPEFTMQDYLREISFNPNMFSYKKDLLIYDIQNNSWEDSNLKFKKRAFHNLNYYNGKIYVLGGKRISNNGIFEYLQNEIEVFDIKNQNIQVDKTNPHQASNAASFTYNDNIIVIGGSIKMDANNEKTFTNKAHQYNITSGYWYELPSMPVAKETSGVLINDKIYLIGGSNGKNTSQIEFFDLKTEEWHTEGELFTALERPAVTFNENIIYFFEDNTMYLYDIQSKQLKQYITDIRLKGSSMHYYNNKLYILGGTTQDYFSTLPSDNVYSIDIEEFDKTQLNRIKVLSSAIKVTKVNL